MTITVYAKGLTVEVIDNAVSAGALIPARGSQMITSQWSRGPVDWIDPASLPAPVPWTNYADPANWILAPSQNGVRPSRLREINLYGNRMGLYDTASMIAGGRQRQWNPQVYSGDNFVSIVPRVRADPAPVGVRGKCLVDAYATWRGHPSVPGNKRAPLFVGLDAAGRLLYAMPNGDMVLGGTVPGQDGPHDFAFNEPNRAIFYVANTGAGRIDKVDRTAAIAARVPGAFEDSSLWVTTPFATGFQKPTSVETLKDGTMFVADELGNAVYRVAADGSKAIAVRMTAPFWLRRLSTGELVVVTLECKVCILDPVSGSLSANWMPAQYMRPYFDVNGKPTPDVNRAFWVQVGVDEYGVLGPVDEWRVTESHGAAQSNNVGIWEFRTRGTQVMTNSMWGGQSVTTVGDFAHAGEWVHYGWSVCYHVDQAVFLAQGFGNCLPAITRASIPSDVAEEPHDHALFRRGQEVIKAGTTYAYQQAHGYYARPSLSALMGVTGWGLLGITADWLTQQAKARGWGWLETYIQSGMGGTTPRPEIVGRDLYGLMYLIAKSSQQYLSEGATLIDAMKTYVLAKYPTAGVEIAWPVSPDADRGNSETFVRAALTGGQIVVSAADMYGNARSIPPAALVDVYVDQGRPAQIKLAGLASPWRVGAPSLTPGPHALTCYANAANHYSFATMVEA